MTVDTQAAAAAVYDLDAERVVIGALMSSPDLIDEVAVRLVPDDFYNPRHGELYAAILAARDAGTPTEPIALAAYLADRGDLTRLGGADYLHTCLAAVPVAAQTGWYVNRVLECAARRRLQAAGVRLTQASTSPGMTAQQVADLAADLLQQAQPRAADHGMVPLGDLLEPGLAAIEHRKATPAGIPTGFRDLDRMLGGLRPKQLITIAAPTGAGKSVLLTDIARHIAIKQRLTVAMFSLEMSREEIFERILAAEAGVSYQAIRDGDLSDRDWQRVSSVIGPMSVAPLFICDDSDITVRQIKTKCQILRRQHGLDAVVVDYMQLVQPSRRYSTEQEQVADVSRGLKVLASELNLPVIAAAQMNRNPDMRADKLPQLSDLRGSGAIASDSNVVLFVHRPDYYDPESPRRGEADLVVRKARNAERGVVTVLAQLHLSRFVDMASFEEDDQ